MEVSRTSIETESLMEMGRTIIETGRAPWK